MSITTTIIIIITVLTFVYLYRLLTPNTEASSEPSAQPRINEKVIETSWRFLANLN